MQKNQIMQLKGVLQRGLRVSLVALTMAGCLWAAARPCSAAVSANVVVTSAPAEVDASDPSTSTFTVSFSATASGKPNDHAECEIDNLTYDWTVTVAGSDGGSVVYHGSSPTVSVSHTANNLCQFYTVTASCKISYDTSVECEIPGNKDDKSDSKSVDIPVIGTPCTNLPTD